MNRPKRLALLFRLASLLAVVLATRPASAEPWFGWGDNRTEDRYVDGDIDIEDVIDGARVGRSHTGSESIRAGTWLTLGGILRVVEDPEHAFRYLLHGSTLHGSQAVAERDRCVPVAYYTRSGPLGRAHCVIHGNSNYKQTGLLQAWAAMSLTQQPPRRVGLASACQAFGHRQLLGVMRNFGLVLEPVVTFSR